MSSLDALDKKILKILKDNARIPFTKIAEDLKVPDTTIHFRINKMLKNGIIRKFSTLINPIAFGFAQASLVKIKVGGHIVSDLSVKFTKEFAEKIAARDDVIFVGIGPSETEIMIIYYSKGGKPDEFMKYLENSPDIVDIEKFSFIEIKKGDIM